MVEPCSKPLEHGTRILYLKISLVETILGANLFGTPMLLKTAPRISEKISEKFYHSTKTNIFKKLGPDHTNLCLKVKLLGSIFD